MPSYFDFFEEDYQDLPEGAFGALDPEDAFGRYAAQRVSGRAPAEDLNPGNYLHRLTDAINQASNSAVRYRPNVPSDVSGSAVGGQGEAGHGTFQMVNPQTGQVLLSRQQVAMAQDFASQSLAGASTSGIGNDPNRAVATLEKRVMQAYRNKVDQYGKALERSGNLDQGKIRELQQHVNNLGYRALNKAIKDIGEEVGGTGWRDFKGAIRINNMSQMQGVIANNPQVAQQISAAGGLSAFLGQGGGMVGGGGGMAFDFTPPGGGGGGWGNQGGGFFGSPFSRMNHSLYMAGRMWDLTGKPVIQSMDAYTKAMADIGAVVGMDPRGVRGVDARRSLAEMRMGQGAYGVFGDLRELGTALAIDQGASASGRMFSTARVGIGLGLTGSALGVVGSQLAGMAANSTIASGMAPALGAGAAALPAIGAGLGAGLIAAQGTTEIMNQLLGTNSSLGDHARTFAQGSIAVSMAGGRISGDQLRDFMINNPRIGSWLTGDNRPTPNQAASSQAIENLMVDAALGEKDAAKIFEAYRNMTGVSLRTGTSPYTNVAGIAADDPNAFSRAQQFLDLQGIRQDRGMVDQFLGLSRNQQETALTQVRRTASRAGMFSSIGSYSDAANFQLASRFVDNIDAGGALSVMSSARRAGVGPALARGIGTQMVQDYGVTMAGQYAGLASTAANYLGTGAYMPTIHAVAGLSMDQTNLMGSMMGGDLRAYSWAANTGQFGVGSAMRLYDQSNNPIFETNWGGFTSMLAGQAGMGNPIAMAATQGATSQAGITAAMGITGLGREILSQPGASWRDYSTAHRNRMFGIQMAGAGLALQGVNARAEYLWGGGQWTGTPAAGSMWAMQDQMRSMRWQLQQGNWAFTRERADALNVFAQRREDIAGRRMGLRENYFQWQTGFQRAGMQLQQGWQREDWAYQDQMRSLQWGWNLEDINEAIRLSGGRQRRQLVRQRDRMTLTHNLEGGQIDTQRDRQETLWARQEERFEAQTENQERLMELDRESYELNVEQREQLYTMDRENLERRIEEAEAMHKLQEEIIAKQRDFQAEQLERQKQQIGLQAAAAAAQKEYQDNLEATKETFKDTEGYMKNIASYEKATMVMEALEGLMGDINDVSILKINTLRGYLRAIVD